MSTTPKNGNDIMCLEKLTLVVAAIKNVINIRHETDL